MEKKTNRKLLVSLGILIGILLLLYFVGIPLFTRFLLLLSWGKSEEQQTKQSELLFPPSLNPTFEATNSAMVKLSGYADKEAKVRILVNGKGQEEVEVDKDGKFEVKRVELEEGSNEIKAILIKDKEESSASPPLTIVYKKEPPKLEISKPNDGDRINENREYSVEGKTDPGNRVTVNDRLAIVDRDGNFRYRVSLSDGETTFKIVATDAAGNTTKEERKVNFSP